MKYLLILTFLFIKCNSQNKNIIPVTKSFKVVHSNLINENDLDKYELADYGKIRNEQAPIGDQISRMWQNFGKPETIMFEGFDYYIQDEKSGVIFIAYFGAGGPAYASSKDDIPKINAIIKDFENLLDNSINADCEIEIQNDFGTFLCGAKNGIPYDREK
ncbi:hypothetical protein [Chryseobacterium sp. JUb7]|uniref:hypothetical protein n=1 Tax=Chryseobacterium sp. JUb7 TaxID=2940599 RepID=UPI002167B344|nr:hypothetical protein [Chryseobacterium sp. JUb7]MCS3529873.1 hypothetical protein [Chryseobacterium sp. JUb7]